MWFHARDRLELHPRNVDVDEPGGEQVQQILQASWSIACMSNALRNLEGTGHGCTLPTGVTSEVAHLVVREACSVAQLVLATLDRYLGNPLAAPVWADTQIRRLRPSEWSSRWG
ncbi:abortive infection family protein [Candidatus Poriferisodalis sp.]|uniref:abortive infection family protein n=1 Tax=Candidatus Poriferisodalis sp. TaxID=3101277 RepID=UPI003B025B11